MGCRNGLRLRVTLGRAPQLDLFDMVSELFVRNRLALVMLVAQLAEGRGRSGRSHAPVAQPPLPGGPVAVLAHRLRPRRPVLPLPTPVRVAPSAAAPLVRASGTRAPIPLLSSGARPLAGIPA